jgi:hypothetical protein
MPGFTGVDSMPAIVTDLIPSVPSIVPGDVPAMSDGEIDAMSDDECVLRLAQAIEAHDARHLDEVARLMARLAVTIE